MALFGYSVTQRSTQAPAEGKTRGDRGGYKLNRGAGAGAGTGGVHAVAKWLVVVSWRWVRVWWMQLVLVTDGALPW